MLLGRELECERLRRLVDQARRGRSDVLVLRGAPGVGKTALLDQLIQEAEGFQLLHVLGLESELELPYSGLHALLRPVVHLAIEIPDVQAHMLRIALALEQGTSDPFVTAAGVLSLLAEAAERAPVLVAVDDAHWLDRASADALLFAARRLRAESVAIVFVIREHESILEQGALEQLEIGPLADAAALALLRERWGARLAPSVARRLVSATGGNPLALVEVTQLLSDDERLGRLALAEPLPVPEAIARAVRRRLTRAPESTRHAMLLLATDDLAQMLLDPADLATAEDLGLIYIRGRRAGFVHPLYRAAIYDRASDDDRRAAHRLLAQSLTDTDPDRRAWHHASAIVGTDEDAAAALEEAAGRAEARGGSAALARALERAAELSQDESARWRRLCAAANASFLAGEPEHALRLIERVLPSVADPLLRADFVRQRVAILAWRGPPVAAEVVESEAARVERVDPVRAARLLLELESDAIRRLDARAFARAADRVEPLIPLLDSWWQPRVRGGVAQARMWNGDLDRALELFGLALEDPLAAATQAPALVQLELYHDARKALEASLEFGRQAGQPLRIAWTQACFGELEHALGRYAEAIAASAEALSLAEEMKTDAVAASALLTLARIAAEQGREQECREYASLADELAGRLRDEQLHVAASLALALLALGTGMYRDATELLEPVAERVTAGGLRDPSIVPYAGDLIESYARNGQQEAARRELELFATQAEATGRPSALATIARCEGLLADVGDVDRFFRQALDRHEPVPSAFARARTQLCYGERLRRLRRRRDAREQLRQALAAFDAAGAAPWAERARAELHATGEHVPHRDPTAPERLTPQELQVAMQVATGKSNRDVAATLFLSAKTVEYHLTHVYRKLELHSRAELIRLLTGEATATPQDSSPLEGQIREAFQNPGSVGAAG